MGGLSSSWLGVESQGRKWIPRPAPLALGLLACVRGGLIRIFERTVRGPTGVMVDGRPNLSRAHWSFRLSHGSSHGYRTVHRSFIVLLCFLSHPRLVEMYAAFPSQGAT